MNFKIDIKDLENQIKHLKKENLELGRIIDPILEKYDLEKKEELEVCQIGKFVYKIDSNIRIIDKPKPPSPDFTLEFNNKIIGLEHTRISTKYAKEYFSVLSLIKYAEQVYKEKYSKNVHAIISINTENLHYKKEDQLKIAENIADFVEWTRNDIVHEYPDFIDYIRTTNHSMVVFSYKEKTRYHVVLTRERLKNEIHKKESKIDLYLKNKITFDEIWLVLFVGSLNSASFELNDFESYKMESKYNHVYLMADFDEKILQVK